MHSNLSPLLTSPPQEVHTDIVAQQNQTPLKPGTTTQTRPGTIAALLPLRVLSTYIIESQASIAGMV